MNPLPIRTRRSTFFILSFLTTTLFAFSSAAPNRVQQASVTNAQAASPVAFGLLKLTVTVSTKNGLFVAGLTKDNFTVLEGKTPREISHFSDAKMPASIGVLVDVSKSMMPQKVNAAKYVAASFIEQSHPENEYFISEFSNDLYELVGWTRDAREITEGLHKLGTATIKDDEKQKPKPHGLTALYDSCAVALDKVARGSYPKHVLLLITDGRDTKSRISLEKIRQRIKESDVLIYGIDFSEREDLSTFGVVGRSILDELAAISGGRTFSPKTKSEIDEVAERIALELQQQYVIGFVPLNSAQGGKWNKVKIKVTPPDAAVGNLSVRSREGYFSPMSAP